jgi:hypothetical protein
MLDEKIINEQPPLYGCYGHIGQQVSVPLRGRHVVRVLHGAINILTGSVLLLITEVWDQQTHQYFLRMIRSHWRAWNVVLFEDRGSPHTAEESVELADDLDIDLDIEVRLLPVATPELNAMDYLWRHVTADALANRPVQSINETADHVCQHIYSMSSHQRLKQAGVLADNFWLRSLRLSKNF